MTTHRLIGCLAACWCLAGAPIAAQEHQHDDHGSPADQLGTVHFEHSCSAAVGADVDKGVALLHSFWFDAAITTYGVDSPEARDLRLDRDLAVVAGHARDDVRDLFHAAHGIPGWGICQAPCFCATYQPTSISYTGAGAIRRMADRLDD